MMTKEAYMALYEKYNAGKCSPEELRLLEEYRDAFELTDEPWDETAMGDQEQTRHRIRKRLFRRIGRSASYGHSYAAAAVVLIGLMLFIGLYIYPSFLGKPSEHAPILPGGNKALLTLEDGTQVALDKVDLTQLSQRGYEGIRKLSDGVLEYSHQSADVEQHANRFHTITTPRGGQFQVVLSDGTEVWLNAESSIRFPLEFAASERRVEVVGEAFFDVKSQAEKPFSVQNGEQTIQVLGTSFVVSSYPDEHTERTALLDGKVRVDIADRQYQLDPGQRAVYDKRRMHVQTEPFDPEEALAWKSGYFLFKAEPIESVMRKIARWYDVEVSYQGDMRRKQFSGSISKFDQIQDLLKMLALTGTVNFKIEGRRVIVME